MVLQTLVYLAKITSRSSEDLVLTNPTCGQLSPIQKPFQDRLYGIIRLVDKLIIQLKPQSNNSNSLFLFKDSAPHNQQNVGYTISSLTCLNSKLLLSLCCSAQQQYPQHDPCPQNRTYFTVLDVGTVNYTCIWS